MEVVGNDGNLIYHHEFDSNGVVNYQAELPGPKWDSASSLL
jgi:hypothetical protein